MVADATPDAYAIFAGARAAVTSARYPDAVDYTIVVTGSDGIAPRANHYRADSRPGEDIVNVAAISQEQAALPPPVPHGINFNLTAMLCGGHCDTGQSKTSVPVSDPVKHPDLIGVPILDPSYMFGLRGLTELAPRSDAGSTTSPRVIATVESRGGAYRVQYADTVPIDGVPTYHLVLTPLFRPKEFRLRELWVDVDDHLPRRAEVAGNFTNAPLVDVPWTIDFSVIDGAPFIASETAEVPLHLRDGRVVRDASIAFEDVRASDGSLVDRPLVAPETSDSTLTEP